MADKKEIILFSFILLNVFISIAQTKKYPEEPRDTMFYPNGQIRRIYFDHEYFSTRGSNLTRHYKIICDTLNQTQTLDYETTGHSSWNVIREHYKDSLVVIHIPRFKTSRIVLKDKAAYNIFLGLKTKKPLNVYYKFQKTDSLVSSVWITRPDTLDYTVAHSYYNTDFRIATSFSKDMNINLSGSDRLSISFYDKYFMRRILYQWQDENDNWTYTTVNFDYKNVIIDYGNYVPGNGRQGMWYEYYPDRTLKSEGAYSGSEFEGREEVKKCKTGVWKYYSEENCLTKMETWDDGKLLSTNNY